MDKYLQIKELSVRLGKNFSVGPISIEADYGIIHLRGANGSGKTTLLRAIVGQIRPTTGYVNVGGRNTFESVDAKRDIALAPSAPELPSFLNVGEAYRFAASLRSAPDWQGSSYCEALDLEEDLLLAHASAGQRKKAELICALAGDPRVLLLDETLANLDEFSAATLCSWVSEWAQVKVIIITHHGDLPFRSLQEIDLGNVKSSVSIH